MKRLVMLTGLLVMSAVLQDCGTNEAATAPPLPQVARGSGRGAHGQ